MKQKCLVNSALAKMAVNLSTTFSDVIPQAQAAPFQNCCLIWSQVFLIIPSWNHIEHILNLYLEVHCDMLWASPLTLSITNLKSLFSSKLELLAIVSSCVPLLTQKLGIVDNDSSNTGIQRLGHKDLEFKLRLHYIEVHQIRRERSNLNFCMHSLYKSSKTWNL